MTGKARAQIIFILLISFFFSMPVASIAKDRLNILTSFLPIYIFTKNVTAGIDGVDVDCLLSGDAGPHDYQMRPGDMRRVEGADIIILNGLGVEDFLDDALENLKLKRPPLESAAGLPLIVNEEEGGGSHEHEHGHHHGSDYNPHTWVSPKMAAMQVRAIAEYLSEVDPEREAAYRKNGDLYAKQLEALHLEMLEVVGQLKERKVVTFHNAFDYLARDIGLEIAAVIQPSMEQLSAGDLVRLIAKLKANRISVVFAEPQFSKRTAELIAREASIEVSILDPVATGEMHPDYYEKVMRTNLQGIKSALKGRL
jgi:ABC-type Zn uptake system ZnuABC Zn-binding protein ZnuA